MVFKPHNSKVLDISFSEINFLLATTSDEAVVFFFDTRIHLNKKDNQSYIPLKFINVNRLTSDNINNNTTTATNNNNNTNIICRKLNWRLKNNNTNKTIDSILLSCTDGTLRDIDVSSLIKTESDLLSIVETNTYETTLLSLEYMIKIPIDFSVPVLLNATKKSNSVVIENSFSSDTPPQVCMVCV